MISLLFVNGTESSGENLVETLQLFAELLQSEDFFFSFVSRHIHEEAMTSLVPMNIFKTI